MMLSHRSLILLLLLAVCVLLVTNASLNPTADVLARKEHVLRTHMSTKTMYPVPTASELADDDAQLTNNTNKTNKSNKSNKTNDSTCEPIQLNFVIRHGTRFPTVKDINRISATHSKLRRLAASLPPPLQSWATDDWRNPYDPNRPGWLAPAGVFEQIALGKRLRERFHRRTDNDSAASSALQFHADAFVVEHTYKPRTLQSAMGFAFGFFNGVQPIQYASHPMGKDHALRFFANCPAFDARIEHNATATAHHTAYRSSRQMQRNLRAFRRAAGDSTASLTQKDLEAAYAGCAFDVAVRNEFSEWCALLDDETLLSMDYFHDLKHFYKKSHGHALALEIAAPLLQDVYHSMRARLDGHSRVEGHFRFAHAETILPLASLLNLSYFDRHVSDRGGHFLADTPLDVAMQRPFRGSVLAPFSANIGFVLYQCGGHANPYQAPTYRVQTLLHERTVRFPACENQALCPFETFETMFHQWIHEYDFVTQCAVK